MKKYYIYGLGIQSEIKLYQLEQYDGSALDVKIHYGRITADIEEYVINGKVSSMSPVRAWFMNDAGHFVIMNGNEIIVQPAKDASEEKLASFILGWCIAFIFQQRGCSAIHCSALEINNQAVFIAGDSGSGKSTLTLALLERGCRYLADDIAVADIKNDLLVQPAFPQQKICRDVAEQIKPEDLFYIDERKDKFAYINKADFCDVPRKLTTVFLLSKHEGAELVVERIKGVDKWRGIINNLFLRDAYIAMGFSKEEIDRCLEIAGRVEIYAVRRPKEGNTVSEICEKIGGILNVGNMGDY